jgi:mRNA-degrading endonuclease RelE of RelBE toxin-antitoxin system
MPEFEHYQIKISPVANDKMYLHFEFLARVSETAAENLLDTLISDISSLEHLPKRNPAYERTHLKKGTYRYMISAKRYRIVYMIVDDIVYVDDIQDCRQNEDKHIM